MAKYMYIQTEDGDKYFLDAVFSINYDQKGAVTKYAVESGSISSDHYSNEQDTLSVSGAVSAVKFSTSSGESTSLELFEKNMTALKKSGKFFTAIFSDNLNPLNNCLFSSLSMVRDTETGVHSINVNMSITQIVVADRAETVATPKPLEQFEDIVESKKNKSGNTVEASEVDKKQLQDVFISLSKDTGVEFLQEVF